VISTSSVAELGAIRLAWWREKLEEIDEGAQTPAEPRLRAVADILISRGVTGRELSRLEDCWLPLLNPFPWGDSVAAGLRRRGAILFAIGARLLGCESKQAEAYGAIWSLVDGIRHCSDPDSRRFLIESANAAIAALPRRRINGELRPLTMIAAFAVHDVLNDGRGGWRRVISALRHSMFGMMPR
jgi:15-cis-phytoene synthase